MMDHKSAERHIKKTKEGHKDTPPSTSKLTEFESNENSFCTLRFPA